MIFFSVNVTKMLDHLNGKAPYASGVPDTSSSPSVKRLRSAWKS